MANAIKNVHIFLGTLPLVENFYSRNFVVVKRKGKQASALSSSIARGGHIQSLQTLIVNSRVVHIYCEKKTKEVVGNVTPSPFLLRNPKLFIRRSWWSHIVSAFRQTILESVLVSWKMQKKPPGNVPIIGPFYQETKRGPNLSWLIRNFDTSTDGNLLDLMILWFHFIKSIALSVSQPLRHSLTGLGEFCSRFWSQIHAISFLVLFIISLSQGQKLFHLLRSWSSLWMSVLVHWTSIDSLKNNVQLSKLSTLSKSFYMDLSAPSALTVSKCGYFDLF